MHWDSYVEKLIKHETVIDDLNVSFHYGDYIFYNALRVPPIVKASVLMTEKMLDTNKKNMFIFPEQGLTSFLFMLFRTLYCISEGKIAMQYNPHMFKSGEKLKLKNSVMEFLGIKKDSRTKKDYIWVKFADMNFGLPLEIAPFLQHAKSKRLSKYSVYCNDIQSISEYSNSDKSGAFINRLSSYKTHIESSTIYIAPIQKSRRLLSETVLSKNKLSDLLLLVQTDSEGNIHNMTSGQLSGTPAIVLCQDLYCANGVIEKGNKTNSVFVEATQSIIDNQLDAIDELISKNIPIVLIADQVSVIDYTNLKSRGFSIWMWNESTIAPILYGTEDTIINTRVRNAAKRHIQYFETPCRDISDAAELVLKHKKQMEEQSATLTKVFWNLYEMTFNTVHAISPLDSTENASSILNQCKQDINREKNFISEIVYSDLNRIIDILLSFYQYNTTLPKVETFLSLMEKTDNYPVYLVISKHSSKHGISQYIESIPILKNAVIEILYPDEYYSQIEEENSLTVVCSWFGKSVMNKLLCANISQDMVVLLYDIELRWKNAHIRRYNREINDLNNLNMQIFYSISDEPTGEMESADLVSTNDDIIVDATEEYDVAEAELTLKQYKYRQYTSVTTNESIEAIPVNFVGDLLAFYRTGRNVLTATNLILEGADSINEIKPSEIQIGDFVIERETQRDLIRDIADTILENSGYTGIHDIAGKWKEALRVESLFSSEDEIFQKIKKAGCMRGWPTIHSWLYDDDRITPQSKEDLVYIAKATDDSVLLEMVDRVYDAGKIIKSAHIQAGHHLAEKLRANIAASISGKGIIDSYNVWQPIDMEIEGIGKVKLLKVIDIGSEVVVDLTSTNRLIDTNRITW